MLGKENEKSLHDGKMMTAVASPPQVSVRSLLDVLDGSRKRSISADLGSGTHPEPQSRTSSRSFGQNQNGTQSKANTPPATASAVSPQAQSARGSPAPQSAQPTIPNGKPSSPFGDRQNPLGPNGSIAAQTVSSSNPKIAAQQASDMRNVVRRKLTGYVGFANLPNQWHRKSVRKGFNFNVMVVGM
jgi:hypothetical protein